MTRSFFTGLFAAIVGLWSCGTTAAPDRESGFDTAAADLSAFIEREREDKRLPGVSIAVVDRGEIVWAAGFGATGEETARCPVTAESVHRAGSISKLCIDLALMRLVEAGDLDLDAPVQRYLPEFRPENSFGVPITVRHLITHHAGLVREPPVGHYFDDTEPSLAQTVASMNRTALVYEPGTRLKYSNAGLAVAGRVLEAITGEPYERHVARVVFEPLGLSHTDFARSARVDGQLAAGTMWTYDGREFLAPELDLGMGPAANLYATAPDLARLAASWSLGPDAAARRQLDEDTLRAMFAPQLSRAGRPVGVGLGFFVDRFGEHLRVGHGGAMYGFATELAALPEADCAVAVVVTVDFANSVARRIADRALAWVLASRERRRLAPEAPLEPVGAVRAGELAGAYDGERGRLRAYARGEELLIEPPIGERVRVRRRSDDPSQLVVDGRLAHGSRLEIDGDSLRWRGVSWTRTADPLPEPVPEEWRALIGEYGWDHNVLYVLERDGRLCILIEWFELYPLEALGPHGGDHFRLAHGGLYASEGVRFTRDTSGALTGVTVGAVHFPRRPEAALGDVFRIDKQLDETALRAAAKAAQPPQLGGGERASDLVDLASFDPTIRFDVRYASERNFMGLRFYEQPRALMQRPAAEALLRAHRSLETEGYGLIVFDAYRPWYVTKMFWDATPERLRHFVADPSHGSRHNRGCAVDLSLFDRRTGRTVAMVSGFDEFTPRAYPDYPGGTSRQRWHREVLRQAMERAGFTVYEAEWWHFDHRDWRRYSVENVPL